MPLADRLKTETAEAHLQAEKHPLMAQMLSGRLPAEQFLGYYSQLYLAHQWLEQAIGRAPVTSDPLDMLRPTDDGHHSHLLASDLAAAGVNVAGIMPGPAVANLIASFSPLSDRLDPQLVGMRYVLEGSTNGNRMIAPHLRKAYASTGNPLTYLDPYGESQRPRWQAFRAALNTIKPQDHDAVLKGATAMFHLIHDIAQDLSKP